MTDAANDTARMASLYGVASMRPRAFAAAAVLLFASVAHAGLVEIVWDAKHRNEQRLSIEPGGFVELCGRLAAGAKVRWQFEAGAPTSFNIHYHRGKTVRFPAKEEHSLRSAGTLDVATDQDYCWMWTNQSDVSVPVEVQLKIEP